MATGIGEETAYGTEQQRRCADVPVRPCGCRMIGCTVYPVPINSLSVLRIVQGGISGIEGVLGMHARYDEL